MSPNSLPHFFNLPAGKAALKFLWLLTLLTFPALAWGSPIISKIKIRSTDIFDFETKPYIKKIPYTWINFLHIKTKEKVIQRELLFKEGDPADGFLFEETERNLRALSFIRGARVVQFPQRDGTVLVVVYVNDSWTTEPQLNLSGINKVDDIEFGFKEKNLFGYGKSLSVLYNTDSDSSFRETTYRYKDQQFFNTRNIFQTSFITRDDGQEKNVQLERPFYSADTRVSAKGSYQRLDEEITEFNPNNTVLSKFDQTKEISEFSVGTKVGQSRRHLKRAGLRYRREQQAFAINDETIDGRPLPRSEKFQLLFTDLSYQRVKFVKLTKIEKMTRIEDINLGPQLSVSPGMEPKFLTGKPDVSRFAAQYSQGFMHPNGHLFQFKATHSSRETFDRSENELYTMDARYYHRHHENGTLVTRLRLDIGSRLDQDSLLRLGGDNGLRGFEREGIVGNRGYLVNVEERLFLVDDLWSLVSIGAVGFYDGGYLWQEGQEVDLTQTRSNVGIGFRFGLTKSSNEVIVRLDLSYRLHRLDSDDTPFVVSFGSGHAF